MPKEYSEEEKVNMLLDVIAKMRGESTMSGRAFYEKYDVPKKERPKKRLSAWNEFVRNNSNKKKFQYADGKLKLRKMSIAYKKTRAYKRNKKRR